MNKDLTVGKPEKVLWAFCLPLFASVIFQQLYNIADSLVAGKMIGEQALAAVGNSYEITLILLAFSFGCNMGCSVLVSRLFGAKEIAGLKSAVSTAMIFSGLVCILLMALTLFFGGELLILLNTPEEILEESKLYLDIYVYGLPFIFFYNLSNGIFSGLGDSKTPFRFLAVSSTANIFMDIIFTKWFISMGMSGIAGIAWATFICQGISCILAVTVIFRRLKRMTADGSEMRWFDRKLLADFLAIAIPTTLQQSFISVGNVLIQRIINNFGTPVIAGYAASIKLNNMVITSMTTLGNGVSNYTAQNLGAGRKDRISKGALAGLKLSWLIVVPIALLYFIFGEYAVRFFMTEPTKEAVQSGLMFLRIVAPFYIIVPIKLTLDGVLRGAVKMRPFMIATLTDLMIRVVFAFILSGTGLGSTGIWCAWPIGWIIGTLLSFIFYRQLGYREAEPEAFIDD